MGSKPVTVKQVVKIRKSKHRLEKSYEKSATTTENPNCELLLAYYASESAMNKKIKGLYEIIFAHEEHDIYDINLSYMNFDVKCAYHLKIILHFFINLQELKLSKIGLNSKNLKRISRSLSAFSQLSFLHIDGNKLDIEGITLLVRYFKYWGRLKVLNLNDNSLDAECLECLGKSLGLLPDLTELHLSGNNARDQGALSLSQGIPDCKYLGYLSLTANSLSYDGIKAVLNNSGSLRNIDVAGNDVSKEVGFLLISKYKDIEIVI